MYIYTQILYICSPIYIYLHKYIYICIYILFFCVYVDLILLKPEVQWCRSAPQSACRGTVRVAVSQARWPMPLTRPVLRPFPNGWSYPFWSFHSKPTSYGGSQMDRETPILIWFTSGNQTWPTYWRVLHPPVGSWFRAKYAWLVSCPVLDFEHRLNECWRLYLQ